MYTNVDINKVKQLISNDLHKEACQCIINLKNRYENESIILLRRLNELDSKLVKSILSEEKATIERNSISNSILSILNLMKDSLGTSKNPMIPKSITFSDEVELAKRENSDKKSFYDDRDFHGEKQIFISYAREDTQQVESIYKYLSQKGYQVWMDIHDLLPGEDWKKKVTSSIKESTFCLICLSKNAVTKRGVFQYEQKKVLEFWEEKLEDDIFLIPIRLDDCSVPESLKKFQWLDIYNPKSLDLLNKAVREGLKRLGNDNYKISLREWPNPCLRLSDVQNFLKKENIFHKSWNAYGKGIKHEYKLMKKDSGDVIIDYTTNLMWQKGGSEKLPTKKTVEYADGKIYLDEINSKYYGGYSDWRLPTLEEGMSLIEPTPYDGLYLSPYFDYKQIGILTSDYDSEVYQQWVIIFFYGGCNATLIDSWFVKAVRSLNPDSFIEKQSSDKGYVFAIKLLKDSGVLKKFPNTINEFAEIYAKFYFNLSKLINEEFMKEIDISYQMLYRLLFAGKYIIDPYDKFHKNDVTNIEQMLFTSIRKYFDSIDIKQILNSKEMLSNEMLINKITIGTKVLLETLNVKPFSNDVKFHSILGMLYILYYLLDKIHATNID